ncbi:Hypothetical protein SYNTR_1751 [Candidatus Syntrophocurvum alkaliphilum]|uniref:DUF86 domain-containing protein n=1 Tax=Candidatus Syntrophocurvum alkaliphilum TaxID=2293317 RepID=A0A6I6DCF3_9FIRM|nr:DUF86 domain-containing protein [Candidatus Syntrophocurvum alkaliphilum]QGU00345.1 Hypothetical protein SYNTR_1751 [Candidatus Syntrophocurvum alkaliphilum]
MKSDKLYLIHILECIEKVQSYTEDGKNSFMNNTMIQDAVIRNLEVIGEATKKVSVKIREQHNGIPWKKMAGIRDVLIHDYMGVDLNIVWNVVEIDLPPLVSKIQIIVDSYKEQ